MYFLSIKYTDEAECVFRFDTTQEANDFISLQQQTHNDISFTLKNSETDNDTYNQLQREKRAKEYPDYKEYMDGIVKLSIPGREAEGQAQIDKYAAECIAVKARYPLR